MNDSLDMDIGYARNRWGLDRRGDIESIKLITDAEAKEIIKRIHAPMSLEVELIALIYFLRGKVDCLLRDREVANKIIDELAPEDAPLRTVGEYPYHYVECFYCCVTEVDAPGIEHKEGCAYRKARALLAAVKGDE